MAETILHVCTTCRAGRDLRPGDSPLGQVLHGATVALLAARLDVPQATGSGPTGPAAAAIELRETSCLANCERGCSAVLSMRGKWTYLLGGLHPALASDLLDYAAAYAASSNGTVMPSRRAASLRSVVVGRVPPPDDLTTPAPAPIPGSIPVPAAAERAA